jgi:hypothetical protein
MFAGQVRLDQKSADAWMRHSVSSIDLRDLPSDPVGDSNELANLAYGASGPRWSSSLSQTSHHGSWRPSASRTARTLLFFFFFFGLPASSTRRRTVGIPRPSTSTASGAVRLRMPLDTNCANGGSSRPGSICGNGGNVYRCTGPSTGSSSSGTSIDMVRCKGPRVGGVHRERRCQDPSSGA